jgi:hypothetical protein
MALTHDKQIQLRSTAEFIERIDEWRRRQVPGIPSRADAIRALIERGLEADKVPAQVREPEQAVTKRKAVGTSRTVTWTPEMDAVLREMRSRSPPAGWQQTAEKVGVAYQTVIRRAAEIGIIPVGGRAAR